MMIIKITQHIRQNLGICSFTVFIAGMLIGMIHPLPLVKLLLPLACALMLFPAFLDVNKERLGYVAARPLPFLISLFFNILVSPLLMYGLTALMLTKSITGLTVGLLIFGMIPAGGMGPAYTGMLEGNVNLSVTISAVSLFLTLCSVPFWSWIIIGKVVHVPIFLIVKYLFLIIILPMILAVLVRHWVIRRQGEATFADLKGFLQNISVMGLLLMLLIISVTNARFIAGNAHFILEMILPAISFSLLLLIAATITGLAFRLSYGDRVALTIGATTKNTAIAMALAMTAFSGTEALSIAIAGPLVQLPVMLCYLNVLTRFPGWHNRLLKIGFKRSNHMEALLIGETTIEYSSDGYLLRPELWNENLARRIAIGVGIVDLGEQHWAVINYVREYWENNKTAPLIRKVCQSTGLRLDQLQGLFPVGLARGACRIAGLPKPDGCV